MTEKISFMAVVVSFSLLGNAKEVHLL